MQGKNLDIKRKKRRNDFPERQVGFPERNDVSHPDIEMERIHVDVETLGTSKKSEAQILREIRGRNVSQA